MTTLSQSDSAATACAPNPLLPWARSRPEGLRAIDEAARHPRRAVQAVVDLRARQLSPLPAPDWADAARCL